ncbi:MAG: branched-chain amino acid ABC transporter permease [Hyphomicrobiales bacterium]|nr:branched-chain amino acid ABC transporter permease [Hyphomicrobiales bacterium]
MSVAETTSRVPGLSRAAIGSPGIWAVVALLIVYPLFASPFFTFQVGAYALILGTIALSLMFLAGYGGMVSLSQMSVAGLAGYVVAILGSNSLGTGLELPWWLVVPLATIVAALFSIGTGLLAVRTEGIYTIMITLAIGVALFLLAQQNYEIFNGHSGFAGIAPPALGVDWRDPVPFYYLSLFVAAAFYLAVVYIARSPFGLALQAIRDNPRRMRALGFHVAAHRVAAYAVSGVIAGLAGVLLVWFNGRVSPGTIGVDRLVDILVIAVVGGTRHPAGAFLGAIFFVLLDTFAIDIVGAERFNTLIGILFLSIVLFSPDGLLGLWGKARRSLSMKRRDT